MPGKLRKRFTDAEILKAADSTSSTVEAAKLLTSWGRGLVSSQLLTYWLNQLSKSGKKKASKKESLDLREPSPADDLATRRTKQSNDRILIIPDQHAPYQHPDALEFLITVAAKLCPTKVVNLGDETDGHAMSFHDSDPNLDSAGVELEKARGFLKQLASVFPIMNICHSNHGSLIYRRAFKHGIPTQYIKTYREVLFPEGGGEGWEWGHRFIETLPNGERVLFQHQSSGDILANAAHERCSIVQGHEHGRFDIQYRASSTALYFAMTSGCLVDKDSLAFAYGKLFPKKPIIGCSAIVDSNPRLIPMELDKHGRWTGKVNI